MRSRIFLYLFIFAVLYIIFQYANAKSVYQSQESKIENLEGQAERYESQRDSLLEKVNGLEEFTLQGNDYAVEYFAQQGLDSYQLEDVITAQILGQNKANKNNDLVPYAGMEGLMRINNIQVVNKKWILATFTDGKFWGEVLLSYTIDDNKNLTLKTEDQVLYGVN